VVECKSLDGGANQIEKDLIVVSGGSRLIRINLLTLGVGSFTYFARQKESGVLITPAEAGELLRTSSGRP